MVELAFAGVLRNEDVGTTMRKAATKRPFSDHAPVWASSEIVCILRMGNPTLVAAQSTLARTACGTKKTSLCFP
jgi:hypothetical protein